MTDHGPWLTIVDHETPAVAGCDTVGFDVTSDLVGSSPIVCRETTTEVEAALAELERGRVDLAVNRLRALVGRTAEST